MSERYSADPNNLDPGADRPHVTRYLLARGFIKNGETVTDGACGHGYGSRLLVEVAGKVFAFDYEDTFNKLWEHEKIKFEVCDLEKTEKFPDTDVWVSIETIEHLYDPQKFLDKVTDATKRMMIFTSPNMETVAIHEFHHTDVLITNMRKYMEKYPDWIEYNSFLFGYSWFLIFVRKGCQIL